MTMLYGCVEAVVINAGPRRAREIDVPHHMSIMLDQVDVQYVGI
jgi:hypothetical protein